jgi:hypothetical protein
MYGVRYLNARSLTIGGALILLTVTLIGRLEGLISDQILIWAAMIAGMISGSYILSIGGTEWYKRRKFSQKQIECINDPRSSGCDKEKRQTYNVAVRSGFISMFLCGVIFILLEGTNWRIALVIAVFWLFAAAIVGVTSPLMWRLFRNKFLAAAGENEALDRPSEVPRD